MPFDRQCKGWSATQPILTWPSYLEASLVIYSRQTKPFKAAYKELYGEWTATGEKTYTPAGNIRAPSKVQCLEWVKKAWESVQVEVVIKSFRSCGIAVQVDGSEDKEIHCIQDGGVAAVAFEDISSSTAALLASCEGESDSDGDPFKDIDEDEAELEENEVVIDDELDGESEYDAEE